MTNICTTIKQSNRLIELGLDRKTSDMYYWCGSNLRIGGYRAQDEELDVPAWSLAALLGVVPKDKSIDCAISFGYYNGNGEYIEKWVCAFEKEGETTDDFIIETTDGDNPIDACVAMIERLHGLKML